MGKAKKKFDEVKNPAGQVLKFNSKNCMKNSDILYLASRSIEQCQPEHEKKSSQKIEKLKVSKLKKNILIDKTLDAFKPKAKFFHFKNTYFKKMFKTIFFSEIGPVYLKDLKNIHCPLKID